MGQVSFQLKPEIAAGLYLLDQYRAKGYAAMVRKLKTAPASLTDGLSAVCLDVRDAAMHGLGVGTTRDMSSVITAVFVPGWRCRAYTLGQKVNIWRGMSFSRNFLWNDFVKTDLTTQIHALDLPLHFFTGQYGFTANQGLARAFFDQIKSPMKGFYTFDKSPHSPLFEEPRRARRILRQDVLTQTNRRADGQRAG